MTKKKRRTRKQSSSSLVIPVVVGIVVLTVVVGAIVLSESARGQATAGASGNTALPRDTQSIPYPDVPRMSLQEAKEGMDNGQVLLVDVRSKASYDQSHAVGAVSIPEVEVEARLDELPRDKEIVLYCT